MPPPISVRPAITTCDMSVTPSPEPDVGTDDAIGPDRDAVAELGAALDDGGGMDVGHHSSMIMAE